MLSLVVCVSLLGQCDCSPPPCYSSPSCYSPCYSPPSCYSAPPSSSACYNSSAGRMVLDVPAEATVYINNRITRVGGTRREYVSFGLNQDCVYGYDIYVQYYGQAQVGRLFLGAGQSKQMVFNFAEQPSPASSDLKPVPAVNPPKPVPDLKPVPAVNPKPVPPPSDLKAVPQDKPFTNYSEEVESTKRFPKYE